MSNIKDRFMKILKEIISLEAVCFMVVIFLVVILANLITGCSTLKQFEQTGEQIVEIGKEAVKTADQTLAQTVKEQGERVQRAVARVRRKLPDKIRAEINRGFRRWGLVKQKPLTRAEREEAQKRVQQALEGKEYREIVEGNTPILPKLEDSPEKANYVEPVAHKWIPSEELKKSFYERSPKAKTAPIELQIIMLGVWKMNYDFLIYEALRTCEKQKEYYRKKLSQIKDCNKAQHVLGHALDFVPMENHKADWDNRIQFATIAQTAKILSCELARQYGWGGAFRWGGDWDRDNKSAEKGSFIDLPHIEWRKELKSKCIYL